MGNNSASSSELILKIRSAYHRSDFWSKEAKRLYPTIPFLRRSIDWSDTIPRFIREFRYVEVHHAPILELSGETCVEFFGRLASALRLRNELSASECEQLIASLTVGSGFNTPPSPYS